MTKQTTGTAPGADSGAVPSAGVNPSLGGSGTVADPVNPLLPVGAFMTSDHRYYFNGEGPVPSVTTILDVASKPALLNWKAREVARAAIMNPRMVEESLADIGLDGAISWVLHKADEARDTAAKMGSSVHLLADMAARVSESDSEGWKIDAGTQPYLDAFRGFLDRYGGPQSIVSSEHMVWSLNGYGGTYDLLMQMPTGAQPIGNDVQQSIQDDAADQELWLIDIKTSKGYYPEYGLQLAAYRWADCIIVEGDPSPYPMPSITRTGVLHLRPDQYPDTGWRLIEYPTDYDLDYLPFLGLLEMWKWRDAKRFSKSDLK